MPLSGGEMVPQTRGSLVFAAGRQSNLLRAAPRCPTCQSITLARKRRFGTAGDFAAAGQTGRVLWHRPARGRCSVHLALGFFCYQGQGPGRLPSPAQRAGKWILLEP